MEYKSARLLAVSLGKPFTGIPYLEVVDKWLAAIKEACYAGCALIGFL